MPADDAPPPASRVAVGIYDVTKRFGSVTAADGVTLEIEQGEFFALLGPSGCGKTTLLRLVAGFEEPDRGRVELDGTDIGGVPPHRRNVNTVFQSYALFPHLTVFENVAFGLRRRRLAREVITERVRRYLELVQLHDHDDRRPGQLSGGQQQRVALARALALEPSVLLLDEPLGALDLQLRKQMQLELMRIQREVGITFVYVTHDQEEALVMGDRIAVMSAGRVEQVGYPEDIYERPGTRFVAGFIGTSNIVEARVAGRDGAFLRLDGAPGERLLVEPPETRTLRPGDPIAFTVRPEKLSVVPEGGTPGPGRCATAGTVVDVVYQGVSTQLVVRTDSGTTLVVFRQNNERVSDAGVPGTRVQLEWAAEFNVVLADEGPGPTDASRPDATDPIPNPTAALDPTESEPVTDGFPTPTEVRR
ncbi:MAG: ABC transporter ATP-binding protein [Actinomycetota bacterium]